jgi:hypothetical protein
LVPVWSLGWVMHLCFGVGVGLWVWGYIGMIWYEYAKRISNTKGFSLVNELRIVKKVNLLKFSTSRVLVGHKT